MGDLNVAGSKFNGSDAEYFGTLAVVGGIVLVVLAVVLRFRVRLKPGATP